ncbi:MAG TPA: agmatinase [Actinomycetota bacterium]|nr:agmatinase [Actinomycetota bacterium]
MIDPLPHPFLGSRTGAPEPGADALVLGLAVDGGVSFRPGAAQGPSGIRAFSDSIEEWSPRCQRSLEDLDVVDLGDHTEPPATVETLVGGILGQAWTDPARPLLACLGGDHSVTPPVVRAVAARSDRLAVVGFDAHLDLREDYPGDHACTYRRIADAGVPCFVFGPRSGAKSEWDDVPKVLEYYSQSLRMPPEVRSALEGRDVYVTLDIDVLDPSAAPGTGTPEPGGPGSEELIRAVEALEGLRIVAFDLVEVAPPLDTGITQAVAAVLVREMLLRFVSR